MRQHGNGQEETNQHQVAKQMWPDQGHSNGVMNVAANIHKQEHTQTADGIGIAHQHTGTQSESATRQDDGANT